MHAVQCLINPFMVPGPNVLQLPADVDKKIRTNHISPPSENQEIAEILWEAEKKLVEYEEKMDRLNRVN